MKKYLIRALRKIRILKRLTIYSQINIDGVKFKIPIINEVGINNYLSLSESWMHHILKRLLDTEKTFIDVGINLGQTLIKVKATNKSIRYIGFEPNPNCVNYINELIKVNNLQNIEIYPIGISDKSTVLKLNLFSDSEHDSAASIIEEFRDSNNIKRSINVPVFNISELGLTNNPKVGIIKIDVEGAELEVLKGLKERIKSDRPLMLIEILPTYSSQNANRVNRQNEILNLIIEFNYSIFRIIKAKNNFIDIKEMQSFDIHSDLNLCEYIFCPTEDKTKLKKTLANTM
jgi:FkbM family methyltransferase